jgi:hypothetical protein
MWSFYTVAFDSFSGRNKRWLGERERERERIDQGRPFPSQWRKSILCQ